MASPGELVAHDDGHRLATQLVRQRTRSRVAEILREREPETYDRLVAAHEVGRARFDVTAERYESTTLHLVGRVWLKAIRAGRTGASFRDTVDVLDQGTFLRDLCSLCQGIEDPTAGADSFYQAFPDFAARVDQWFAGAAAADPDLGAVDPERFRRKCYGVALYHLLNPLRAATTDVPVVSRGFESDPFDLLTSIETKKWQGELYFAVALGQANDAAARRFPTLYGARIRALLRKRGIEARRMDEVVDDLVGDCVLHACNYFASGPFVGWLWFQCMSYLRRWAPQGGGGTQLHAVPSTPNDPTGENEVAELVRRAWARLSDEHRHVIDAYWAKRQTLNQMASRLGVHETTVLRHRKRAEQEFRGHLREEAGRVLGQDATDEDCRRFLMENSRHVDFGFAPPDPTPTSLPEEALDLDYCPMVPCKLP